MRELIREMISETIRESRKIKKQFYDQVRSKYPDIDSAYFVHWNRMGSRKNPPDWGRARLHIEEMIKAITSGGFDVASNLVDPSGKDTDPNGGGDSFGPIGIVFQGIPTAGFARNVSSSIENVSGNQSKRTRYYDTGFEDYDINRDLINQFGINKLDLSKEKPFLSKQDFFYSTTEFGVVPKRIVGIVYHVDRSDITDGELADWPGAEDHDRKTLISEMKKVAKEYGLPLAIGKTEIGAFYRYLYSNNPRVN